MIGLCKSNALHLACGAFLIALLGCSHESTPTDRRGDSSIDNGDNKADVFNASDMGSTADTRETGVADLANLADAQHDAADDAGGVANLDWVTFSLEDGSSVTGEWLYTYDTSIWWNPLGTELFAVFNPTQFDEFPRDRAFDFVRADDIAGQTPTERPVNEPLFAEFGRTNQLQLAQSPIPRPSYVITANNGYHLEEDGFGDFAWDLVYADENGDRWVGDGVENEDYLVWGERVYSPVSGYVVEVVDSGIDNAPGSYPEGAVNNLVGIHLGGRFYLYILHFQQGSVAPEIVVDSYVSAGDFLGLVGNSGVTLEPHLHVVLLWYDVDDGRSYSVPVEFETLDVAPALEGPWQTLDDVAPVAGDFIR